MDELVSHLGVDWKLLLAQAINFFALLYVLKRFAYGPIMKMLKERRDKIEEGVLFRNEAEENLKRSGEEREKVISKANAEALDNIKKSQARAKELQAETLKESAQKGEAIILEARKRTEEERAKMSESVYKEAEYLIKAGIAKVIGKMTPEEKNAMLIKEALAELKTGAKHI